MTRIITDACGVVRGRRQVWTTVPPGQHLGRWKLYQEGRVVVFTRPDQPPLAWQIVRLLAGGKEREWPTLLSTGSPYKRYDLNPSPLWHWRTQMEAQGHTGLSLVTPGRWRATRQWLQPACPLAHCQGGQHGEGSPYPPHTLCIDLPSEGWWWMNWHQRRLMV